MTDPNPLQTAFRDQPFSAHASRWDALYRDDVKPWDRNGPSLALADLLLQRTDLVPPAQDLDVRGHPLRDPSSAAVVRRTALVPGCGPGHDALLLASFGYDVWALDVSDAALDIARRNEARAAENNEYPLPRQGFERGSVHWVVADFFDEKAAWAAGAGTDGSAATFDLIFDYTFLCALPVDMRPRWAARMAGLLAHKGRLVCLEFPSGRHLSDGGPPWGLNPEVYEALLSAPGEPISYHSSGDGSVVTPASHKPRDDSLHRLSLIKPTRTHAAGTDEDGSVKDFISVWSW